MNGSIYRSAGLAFGIMIGLIIAVALILVANNNKKVRTEYDERQQIARKTAITLAYTVLMVYLAAWMVLGIFLSRF